MEINIKDYLSEDEIKDIVKGELRSKVASIFSNESETVRIIGNMSYHFIWECVDKEIGGNLENKIKEKVIEVLSGLTEFSLFRRKDAWEKQESIGQKILDQAISDNSSIIHNQVKTYLENLDEDNYVFEQAVREAITQKILS